MTKDKRLEEIKSILLPVKKAEKKYLDSVMESERLTKEIKSLEQQLEQQPSAENAQRLGALKMGVEPLNKQVLHLDHEYKEVLRSNYKKAKALADSIIRESTKDSREIQSLQQERLEALESALTIDKEIYKLHDNKRAEALNDLIDVGLSRYAADYGETYNEPLELANENTLPYKTRDLIQREVQDRKL